MVSCGFRRPVSIIAVLLWIFVITVLHIRYKNSIALIAMRPFPIKLNFLQYAKLIFPQSDSEEQEFSLPENLQKCNGSGMLLGSVSTAMRLGNHMFVFASIYGMARAKGMKFGLRDSSSYLSPYFPSLKLEKNLRRHNRSFDSGPCCKYNEKWAAINCGQVVLVGGYLQSFKYFHFVKKEILQLFTFSETIQREARTAIQKAVRSSKLKNKNMTLVGVHIRLKDYATDSAFKAGYVAGSAEFVNQSIELLKQNSTYADKHPLFLLVSDDPNWGKRHFGNLPAVVPLRQHDMAVDMCILTLCDIVVLAAGSSTFGWWGAYLNPAQSVYYNGYFVRKGSSLEQQFKQDDYFLPKWKALNFT